MRVIKYILETLRSVIYMPIYISKIYKRSEDLFRIENKLNLLTQQIDNLHFESVRKQLTETAHLQALNSNANTQIEEQSASDLSILTSTVEQKFDNQFLQFESLLSIYNSLPNLKFLPATRGWAGSPDFLAKLSELIIKEKPRLVLEASSGVSTVVLGLALKLNNHGKVISLDHDKLFGNFTTENVKLNKIGDVANIMHCPLRNYKIDDQNWIWYETDNLNLTEKIDFLVIDGPPGSTQFLARYPAVPLLHQHFSDRTLIVLDDASRKDEVIIIQKWVKFLEDSSFKVEITQFNNFEKGLVILEVYRLN